MAALTLRTVSGDEREGPEFLVATHYLFDGRGEREFESLDPDNPPPEPVVGDRRIFDGVEFELFSILGESRIYWWQPV